MVLVVIVTIQPAKQIGFHIGKMFISEPICDLPHKR